MLAALLSAAGLWLILTWPLPRHVRDGIPYAAHAPAGEVARAMAPGDHLQLLYHFWLMRDMIAGSTPWLHNLYEFNTGDDAERYRPGAYFAPFSLAFTLGDLVGGRALGWHLATGLSLWLAFWSSWLLACRYTSSERVAWVVAVLVTAFPYRWHNLMSGSPTGFGMAWTPLLMWGLDRAIRDGSWWGGLWAGLAMVGSAWAEKHVMFFNAMLIPAWSLLVLIGERPWRRGQLLPVARRALATLPAAGGLLLAYLYANLYTRHLGESGMAAGRTLREVSGFSPHLNGFWDRHVTDVSGQIFTGWVLPGVLLAGLLCWLYRATAGRDGEARRRWIVMAGLLLACALAALLATGPNGRGVGRDLFDFVREALPPYRMIRQAAKVYLLLPALLVPLLAVGLTCAFRRAWLLLAVAVLGVADLALWMRPSISLIDHEQAAYAAVSASAQAHQEAARALVLPLWPGDSHYASVYQFYASLYHLRLANGYSPVVSRAYLKDFFHVFQTANQGALSDAQLDELQARGIPYILLHEDLFPEKVSPFPVGVTLHCLLEHPRLDLLARDGPVWAFQIRAEAKPVATPAADRIACAARLWEAESAHRRGGELLDDPSASGGRAIQLRQHADKIEVSLARLAGAPGLRWWLRVRGQGELSFASYGLTNQAVNSSQAIAADAWSWIRVPVALVDGYGQAGLAVRGLSGSVAVDRLVLSNEAWPLETSPGYRVRLPAALLFHAGATEEGQEAVALQPRYEPAQVVIYGPRLPLSAGAYEIELEFESEATPGTRLGILVAGPRDGAPENRQVEVIAGQPARLAWAQPGHSLFYAGFRYARAAPMPVRALRITRTDAP